MAVVDGLGCVWMDIKTIWILLSPHLDCGLLPHHSELGRSTHRHISYRATFGWRLRSWPRTLWAFGHYYHFLRTLH